MKKLIVSIVLLSALSFITKSQDELGIFKYQNKTIVFFGIDFSHLKYVGNDFKSGEEIKNVYFNEWNRIFFYEENKYSLKPAFRANTLYYELSCIEKAHKETDESKIINFSPKFLTINDVVKIITNYEYQERSGIGVVFIADVYDNIKKKAFVHVVVFNLATREVIICEFMKGKPSGIGMRNYWSNAIADIIERIKNSKYPEWESEFAK